MGSHPTNLIFRFLLEVAGLASLGYWGWCVGVGWYSYVLAAGVPFVMATIWGTFAVPDDPSRSGSAPIPVPGIIRLLLELAFFAFASWALFDTGLPGAGYILATMVLIHYALSFDRLKWLLSR